VPCGIARIAGVAALVAFMVLLASLVLLVSSGVPCCAQPSLGRRRWQAHLHTQAWPFSGGRGSWLLAYALPHRLSVQNVPRHLSHSLAPVHGLPCVQGPKAYTENSHFMLELIQVRCIALCCAV